VQVGFQGPDPSTDLRGAGMLGLRNLHFYVTRCDDSVETYRVASSPESWYFFCASGINFTGKVIDYIEAGKVDNVLIDFQGNILEFSHIMYILFFTNFNRYWVDNKINDFMKFNSELENFMRTRGDSLVSRHNIMNFKLNGSKFY
jgi:hypothetical protein